MHIITSPWQKEFESFIASARKELRIAVPYYGQDTIRMILKASKADTKYFLLKLSDHDVLAGVQSPRAVRMLQEHDCTVKFGKDLHAKILIADQRQAIVTSSNLTSPALSGKNAEMGVFIDDPKIVQAVLRTFNQWYAKAGIIGDADLAKLEALQRKSKSQVSGKRYGEQIQAGGVIPSPRKRHYWVVSPNVKNNPKTVDEWKKASVRRHAAFMGWDPKKPGHPMGPKFAGRTKKGIEGITRDDVILIARRHHGEPDIVGFGLARDKYAMTKLKGFKPPRNVYPGSLRILLPFKGCNEPPRGIPLLDVLPQNKALVQLHPERNDAHKKVCDWLDQHLRK
jgi:phospholipase D-like protein